MIPYINIPPIELGPLTLQPFGIMLAIGVLVGSHMGRRFMERHNMDEETMRWLVIRIIIWGFIGCHIIDVVFYEPHKLLERPWVIFMVWEGISSFGGIISGFAAFAILSRRFPNMNRLRWVDLSVYGVLPGYFFGRIGCAIVHDHVGVATDFPLAVDFEPVQMYGVLIQGPHHDLGLYEVPVLGFLWMLAIAIVHFGKNRPDGLISGIAAVGYSIPRFFFEFFRLEVSDRRWFGLTPAQYFAIIMFITGVAILYKIYVAKKFTRITEPEEPPLGPVAVVSKAKEPPKKAAGQKKGKKKKR